MATKRYDIFDIGLDAVMNKSLDLASFNTQEEPTNVGAMAMTIPSSARSENITSGELPQTIFYAKQSFTDTVNGFRQGFDPTDGLYKWIIGNGTNSIDWNVTTASVLTVIGAISASTIDIGGADATSFHVDVDGNMWLGAATFAAAPASISNAGAITGSNVTITGASSSIAGNALVGSWTATASSLTNTSGGNTVTISTGATAIISGPTGAPTFSVTAAGAMTSTSGLIGAWTINSATLTGGNATLDPLGDLTLGTGNNLVRLSATDATYRLWAGHATASAAPFSVTQDGILRATNASEIVLTVPNNGNVVGLIVTQSDTTNNPVAVSITQNGTGDILNIFDGATERFTILDGGNVGINQATPTSALHVVGTGLFTTSVTNPILIGGTATTSTLTLRSTSGVGTTGADIIFQVGNNGATEAGRILNGGMWLINDTSNANMTVGLTIRQGATSNQVLNFKGSNISTGLTTGGGDLSQNVEDDDYLTFSRSATAGGCILQSIGGNAANAVNLQIASFGGQATTANTTSSVGLINIFVSEHNGSNALVNAATDENIFSVQAYSGSARTTRLLLKGGGDLYSFDGTNTVIISDAWTEIGQTTLGSAATSISVASLPARKDIRIHIQINGSSGAHAVWLRFNNDTASNYNHESLSAGASGASSGTDTKVVLFDTVADRTFTDGYCVLDVLNEAARQKLITGHATWTTNTGSTGIEIAQIGGKWDNEADAINRVDIISSDADTFATGSRVTIYGKRD